MDETMDPSSIYAPSEDLVAREIEGELVIVPITSEVGGEDDAFFSLNEIGKEIWDRLDGKKSLKDIVSELSGEFQGSIDEIESDVAGFISELLRRNMLSKI